MKLRSILFPIILALICPLAFGAIYDGQVNGTAPTTRVGGALLTPAELQGALAGYQLYFNCATTPVAQGAKSATLPIVKPAMFPADGTYSVCFSVYDSAGRQSAMSNIQSVQVTQVANPSPGVLTGVTLTCPGGTPVRIVSQSATSLVVECDAP